MSKPKILLFDVETAPVQAYVWSLWDQNIALNQVTRDWFVLAWSAKWLGDPPSKIMYMDQRKAKHIENDKEILKGIWKLLDQADVVITQNGKSFDQKKLNARFIQHGFKPPSSFKHIDTKQIAKRRFGFTSNKLEYMTDKLCTKYKKLTKRKYSGFDLWTECLSGNLKAWKEMEKYNKYDVLSLEELYTKLQPWDNTLNLSLYSDSPKLQQCGCGSKQFNRNGYCYTSVGKYQRYSCKKCGAESRGRENLFNEAKKKSLRVKV